MDKHLLKRAKDAITCDSREHFVDWIQDEINSISHDHRYSSPALRDENMTEYTKGYLEALLHAREYAKKGAFELDRVRKAWRLVRQFIRINLF